VLRGNLLLAGIAFAEVWYLMSVFKSSPLWTFITVANTMVILLALCLLLTVWFRSD
jgi:hypothetical protein